VNSAGDTLPRVRVSDAERDRVLRLLRDASVQGRLSDETFARRLDQALRSRSRGELADLILDLPGHSRLADLAVRTASSLSLLLLRTRRAWRSPHQDRLSLPADTARSYLLGRAPGCDLLLRHPTVSRSHALLHNTGDGWLLTDLHSTNGTRLNGWIVTERELIRPGDHVSFGAQTFLVTR
jgi:hypothetical protein